MRKLIPTLIGAAMGLGSITGAHAFNIVVNPGGVGGVFSSQEAGVFTNDFSSVQGSCAGYATCAAGGDFAVVPGSGSGYAAPAMPDQEDGGSFLAVPIENSSGSATFGFGSGQNYFGMFWGSIDQYNTIEFWTGTVDNFSVVQSVGGQDLNDQNPNVMVNGNQVSENSNRFVDFYFGSQLIDGITLISDGRAFETDNHAFARVPEPGTLALLGLGLAGLAVARRRKAG